MSEEIKTPEVAEQTATLDKADVQAFVQRKLQILNTKNGARYERDAARVVRNNIQGGK